MLGILRSAAGTWVAKALLSLLVVSFLAWGASTRMAGGFLAGHHSVITAGGTTVSINEYRLAYDRQVSVMVISGIRLVEKTGGKSGDYKAAP